MLKKVCQLPGWHFSISPDSKYIACGQLGVNPCILLYELATGKMVREMIGFYNQVDSMTFSPDGKTLYAQVSKRMTIDPVQIHAWDVATGKERRTSFEGTDRGRLDSPIILSPDGRTIAVRGLGGPKFKSHNHVGGNVALLETAVGGQRVEVTGHKDDVCEVAYSADGRTLATASMDKTVRLWDRLSGKEIGRLEGHSHWVLSIAFSPDSAALVSGGLDKKALVWDVSKITRRRGESAERSSAELEADWKDLGADAAKGYAALGRLVSSPGRTVSFLGKRLQAAAAGDLKPIERLIGALDDEKFQVREQAMKELRAMGDRAAPSIGDALAGNLSAEAKQRLSQLQAWVDGADPSAETIREVRGVEVLEAIGNPAARRLLETLATGPSKMRLTQEAKASARRLAKRP